MLFDRGGKMDKKPWTRILAIVFYCILAVGFFAHSFYFRNYITAGVTVVWIVSSIIAEVKEYKKETVSRKLDIFSRAIFYVLVWSLTIETSIKMLRML